MHRNTFIVVLILAVFAVLVVGANVYRSKDDSALEGSTIPDTTDGVSFASSQACGITFTYPNTHTLMESTASGTVLINETNPQDSMVLLCQQEIPRAPLPPERIESVVIPTASGSSITADLYHDASQNDGEPVDKLIFTHPTTGLDIYIAGFGEAFNAFIRTLSIR